MNKLITPITSLLFAAFCLVICGCATNKHETIGPNQAIVRAKTELGLPQVLVGRPGQQGSNRFGRTLIVPAGNIGLAVLPNNPGVGSAGALVGTIIKTIADQHVKTITFNAKAGHEYEVGANPKPLIQVYWLRGIIVTDKTDGIVVATQP